MQLGHFVGSEVVFGHHHIKLLDLAVGRVFPGSQAHAVFAGIGPRQNDLGCGLAVDGPVQLVLHGGKKALGSGSGDVVVDGCGVDVGDFLVELALAHADFADALELFFKVLLAQDGAVVFQALVIHGEALDGEGLDDAGGPFAELHSALGVYLVAHCNGGGQVVVLGVVAFTVCGSYPKRLDNCGFIQLVIREDVFEVVADGSDIHVIQQPHHFLGKPDVFFGINGLHPACAAGGDEGEVFRSRRADEGGHGSGVAFFLVVHFNKAFPCSVRRYCCRRLLGLLGMVGSINSACNSLAMAVL